MRMLTANLFPHILIEHVLNANIFFFADILLRSKYHDRQAVKHDPDGNSCVECPAMKDIIDCKWRDDQRGNDKLDNAKYNAIESIMGFDSIYHFTTVL